MTDFVNQDFGSESEDDNFNPAPADESDNEVQGDSDEEGQQPVSKDETRRRPSSPSTQFQHDTDQEDNDVSSSAPVNGNTRRGESGEQADDEDAEGLGEDLGEIDDDEDEEEDDDDEEAITVRQRPPVKSERGSNGVYRVDLGKSVGETLETNIWMLRPKWMKTKRVMKRMKRASRRTS